MADLNQFMPDPVEYQALGAAAGLIDFSDRTQIELRGDDRATFLHNFCTQEVRRLPVGDGCEAFVLNVQGKILGHILVFCQPEALVIETVSGQAARLLSHLDRYLIRERVTLHDLEPERAEWLLAGPSAEQVLAAAGATQVPAAPLSNAKVIIGDRSVWLRRVSMTAQGGFLIDGPRNEHSKIGAALVSAGAKLIGSATWQTSRIETGWPLFGIDITDKNLPQEVNRDRAAISFTKGCYLGQETVARIDALGHVNKILVGVRFKTDGMPPPPADSPPTGQRAELPAHEANPWMPAAGTELLSGEHVVGHVTSCCFSLRQQAPLALAYVRRGLDEIGTPLSARTCAAQVVALS